MGVNVDASSATSNGAGREFADAGNGLVMAHETAAGREGPAHVVGRSVGRESQDTPVARAPGRHRDRHHTGTPHYVARGGGRNPQVNTRVRVI